jgi:class 3 adenylate cyclase
MEVIVSSESVLSASDLAALAASARNLAAPMDLRDLLDGILATVVDLTDSCDGAVILYNERRNSLYFLAATGPGSSTLVHQWGEFSQRQVPLEGSKAGEVFTSGLSLITHDLARDPHHFKEIDAETGLETASMVCVPLIAGGERLGVLEVRNKRSGHYTERDCLLAEHFAIQAAVAIRSAQLSLDLLDNIGLYTAHDRLKSTRALFEQLHQPAHTEQVTVMFADLRGFAQLCQILNSPVRTQQFLNEFLTMLSDQIIQHGGLVNKFLGDEVLAIFRAEDAGTSGSERAVRCAFAMVDAFQEIRGRWDEGINQQVDFLDLGVGIVTDHVILGAIGSDWLRDYTAIGIPVGLAAAFAGDRHSGRRILVDQITYTRVKELISEVEGPFDFELGRSGQRVLDRYKQYHLLRLAPAVRRRVFISHAHKDRNFIEKELTRVLPRYGIETWCSGDDIPGGENWVRAIYSGLQDSAGVIVVVSENSAASDWVRQELDYAVSDTRMHGRIIPVALDETPMSAVHPYLVPVQAVDARRSSSVAADIHEWFEAVSRPDDKPRHDP